MSMRHISTLRQVKLNSPMENTDREKLFDAFNQQMETVLEQDNRVLARSSAHEHEPPDSLHTISWDHYFRDLSFGSFRKYHKGDEYVSRRRAWHYLFKNLKLIERIFDQPKTDTHILDVGCASGYLRRFIEGNASPNESKRIYYWGVDVRESVLKKAVTATHHIESGASGTFSPAVFVHHDIKNGLPFKDSHFDAIVNFEMIKYLPIAQAKRLISEFRRTIRDDGWLYMSTVSNYRYYKSREKYENFAFTLSPEEFCRICEDNGFRIVDVYGSQSKFSLIEPHVKEEHRVLFNEFLKYHPRELVAAMFAPIYPERSNQITIRATPG